MDYKEKIKALPAGPGVYIMKNSSGIVLYVGKAGNIRKRVSSYFRPSTKTNPRKESLVDKIADISFISTMTEAEALIYENGLIKRFSPKYNVALKDGKSYPFLKLTTNEDFPRLFMTRRNAEDGASYYGPYADAGLLRLALMELRQMFPLRSCNKMTKRVCLNYYILQCPGPCEAKIDKNSYWETVSELKLFLEAKRPELIKSLSDKMREAASKQDFELAERYRKRLETLSMIKERSVNYRPLGGLEELRSVLGIENAIDRIEALDVSNIMGTSAVGSVICFRRGIPDKASYRRFKIKTVNGIDDYAMIREVARRRYLRTAAESKMRPDLVVVDGGRGHLLAVKDELNKSGLSGVPVISIAKEFEHIYTGSSSDPVVLPGESKALHLIERIRDEAHRFAITYHKTLVARKMMRSELDEIPLIGEKRKGALLVYFGSVEKIRSASLEDLMAVKGLDEKAAKNIIDHFEGR